MIEINITVNEKEDGSVMVHTKSVSIGTTKEMMHALAIIKATEVACKVLVESAGGKQTQISNFRKIVPMAGD